MLSLNRSLPLSVKPHFEGDGFTLIEIVVVMALIGIMLFIVVPNFQHLLTNDTRKASQWILLQVPKQKSQAVSENQVYALHVDIDKNRLWFSNSFMSDEDQLAAMEQGLKLGDKIRILDVLYSNEEGINGGETLIFFYPKGYSDRAILHLEEKDGDRLSFLFEPFLNQVGMTDGYVDFED
jgi:prepilin-type N-terminal cleavage/methylation domain-containing protein